MTQTHDAPAPAIDPRAVASPPPHGHVTQIEGGPIPCGGPTTCATCASELRTLRDQQEAHRVQDIRRQVDEAVQRETARPYRMRAALLAPYSARYPSALAFSDPNWPTWAILTIALPSGHASWHIAPGDLELLQHVPWTDIPAWDGSTPEDVEARLLQMVALEQEERERPPAPAQIVLTLPEGLDAQQVADRLQAAVEDPAQKAGPAQVRPETDQIHPDTLALAIKRIGDAVGRATEGALRQDLVLTP